MSRVDKMSSDAEEFSTKFLEFMRIVGADPELLICIFEGEDEKYFSGRLHALLNNTTWECINTGGRAPAIELFETIIDHPLYSAYKYLCFIDRDYDDIYDNHTPSKLYSTPGYSVENFYFSLACLKKILSAEFNIKPENELKHLHDRYTQLFQKAQKEFIAEIKKFNIWAKTNYIMGKNATPLKMSIKSVKTNELVDIGLESVKAKYDHNDISSVFPHLNNANLCPASFQEATSKLTEQDPELNFRGKNCADFMRLYLLAIKSEIQTLEFKENEKPTIRINFSKDNFLSEVSQYADTPACLIRFLSQHSATTTTTQPVRA
ncbi:MULTISPECIES: DUF4435 domain-containing protein [unclassified Pseudomonas]|uniref:DUF4435 domain-containing protein n=1 Tax=unclassified Pseudomonas TaxID=196821 RepID=UPI00161097B0|nr:MULTISPECIES: DUF4435 domain-containing protein [unclassified Pseudomonas]MBB6286269.1 hypothetical protein [Pseudomonas sp. SJZ073]MBB6311806.1 hypothetical protein [Pseudomonas sp. JAI120]